MNVLFLDQFSDLGGAQRCLLDLLPALCDRGWRAHVAAPDVGQADSLPAGNNCLRVRALALGAEFHSIQCGPYESGRKSAADLIRFATELPRLAREIARLARDAQADILYVNGPRLLPAASLAPLPMVFHCHSYLRQRYAAALAGVALSNARVIGSCRFVLEPLRPFVAGSQVEVVYNGVSVPPAVAPASLPSGRLSTGPQKSPLESGLAGRTAGGTVGVIGRIAPEKGQLAFVEAARMLPRNGRFIICGAPLFSDPAAARYFERVRGAAAGLPIEFPGWQDDVGRVLSELDLLVVPSAPGEATTRVILEAYAAGVPVLASNSGGIPEIVRQGETGYLTPPGDPVKLAARIREALANPARLRVIAENARRAWRERFTLDQYQRRILTILESVGSSARR